jgi:hypothetical protein
MIDSVFLVESIRERHRNAPCLTQRQEYLSYLLEIGTRRERVRNVASMLLHVVRLLRLDSSRSPTLRKAKEGYEEWRKALAAKGFSQSNMDS